MMKEVLFENTYNAFMDFLAIKDSKRPYSCDDFMPSLDRFSALYGVIQDSGLEREYAEWKAANGHTTNYGVTVYNFCKEFCNYAD